MARLRANILPLYLVAALVAYGHAASTGYTAMRLDGRSVPDSALVGATLGAAAGLAWPLWLMCRWWR
jgi:hypothetical protein